MLSLFSLSPLLSLELCLWMSTLSSNRKHTYLYNHTPLIFLSMLYTHSDIYIDLHEYLYTFLQRKPCASGFPPQTLMTLSFWEITIVALVYSGNSLLPLLQFQRFFMSFFTDLSQPKHKTPFTLVAMFDIHFEVSPRESQLIANCSKLYCTFFPWDILKIELLKLSSVNTYADFCLLPRVKKVKISNNPICQHHIKTKHQTICELTVVLIPSESWSRANS